MSLGPLEIFLIIILVLVLFGAGRVPTIAENFAKGIKSFKKGLKDEDDVPKVSASDKKDAE
jgi:sec-independent protein translocase protein TatA